MDGLNEKIRSASEALKEETVSRLIALTNIGSLLDTPEETAAQVDLVFV